MRKRTRGPGALALCCLVALAAVAPGPAAAASRVAPTGDHDGAPPSRAEVVAAIREATGDASDLSPDQTRASAAAMLRMGRPDMALEVTEALLARDPADFQALLLRARAARDMGRMSLARGAARRAWHAAETPDERYAAAMTRAQVLSSDGNRTMAQIWLRRATEAAPDAATRARAVRDFKYVRLRNPWSTRLRFSVSPTDNVNNGSSEDRFTIDGLPWEFVLGEGARALGGTELRFAADTRYRMRQSATTATDLLVRGSHRTYRLSDDAKEAVPGAEGSDYAYSSLSVGLARHMALETERDTELTLTGWAGQNWYAGDPYGHFLRGEARLRHDLDARNRLTGGITIEARRGDDAPEADVGLLSVGWAHGWQGGGLNLYGVLTRSLSDEIRADYRDLRLGARIAPRAEWMEGALGADPALTLEARARDFDASPYRFDGRRDEELRAEVEVTFREVDYYGFNPVLTLETSRTRSNVALHETERTGLELSIRSAF